MFYISKYFYEKYNFVNAIIKKIKFQLCLEIHEVSLGHIKRSKEHRKISKVNLGQKRKVVKALAICFKDLIAIDD